MKVNVIKKVLDANDIVARESRLRCKKAGIFTVNLVSSPGSGKTTLLEKTIPALSPSGKSMVIVGDLETSRDADRLAPYAEKAIQINTGMSCHLYANQIAQALGELKLEKADYLFIENVGNLVCPGEFDLGENAKIVLLSVAEGDDKVAKYPTVFRVADVVLLTKVDLLKVLTFDIQRVKNDLKRLNSRVPLICLSASTGEGMDEWISWLRKSRKKNIGAQAKFLRVE